MSFNIGCLGGGGGGGGSGEEIEVQWRRNLFCYVFMTKIKCNIKDIGLQF